MRGIKQITDTVLMIRPCRFRCNEQTAVNNFFQNQSGKNIVDEITSAAQKEFDNFTCALRERGVKVMIVDDDESLDTPDSIFPNNWISFHQCTQQQQQCQNEVLSDVNIYPMFAVNRRQEKRLYCRIASLAREELGLTMRILHDYSSHEDNNEYLEGTGSLVLDRPNAIAYCALSPRADMRLFKVFCKDLGYTGIPFRAYQTVQNKRLPIYHTNVMMCVAETFSIVCLDCVDSEEERSNIENGLNSSGKDVIEISEEQMSHFAGNMLQLYSKDIPMLVMSSEAYSALRNEQITRIENHCSILHVPLSVIEENGGGSARCMMAEVFY